MMKDLKPFLLVCLLGFLVYMPGLQQLGFEYRDDEIFYVTSTQEMVAQQNYFSPTYFGEHRWQKPILYYWFILLAYKIFGMGWFAARLTSVVCAALTLGLTFKIAKKLFDERVAYLSAFVLATVPLFFRHAKNAVPDMALNFFIVLSMYFFVCMIKDGFQARDHKLFFGSCALGFMVKGFAAFIAPFGMMIIYQAIYRRKDLLTQLKLGRGLGLILLIILPWFFWMIFAHGEAYVNYMLVDETKNRLLGDQADAVKSFIFMFINHMGYYFQVLGSNFAPWSLFFFLGLPLFIRKAFQKNKNEEKEAFAFLLGWVLIVYLFFSSMYFTISHYMLVLSTSFAILVSYVLVRGYEGARVNRAIRIICKSFALTISTFAFFVFNFALIFIVKLPVAVSGVLFIVFVFGFLMVIKSPNVMRPPMFLAIVLALVYSQAAVLSRSGLSSHAVLSKFAHTINQDPSLKVIGVGSHDIHEKEFQVYFDEQVRKCGHSHIGTMVSRLIWLFREPSKVYCLILKEDLQAHLLPQALIEVKPQIIQQEYMIRKRFQIDANFFKALVALEKQKVYDYLMEKIVLVKRDQLETPE